MKKINTHYDEIFYLNQSSGSYRSAQYVVPIIMEYLRPRSVVDIGCGLGTWLRVFQNLGVDVKGVDGNYVNKSKLMIDAKDFFSMDLEKKIVLNHKFDLVMSLEVAEHLTKKRARSFIEDLTNLGDIVLFSAAIPEQGGTNHINENRLTYWRGIFDDFNFSLIDCIRPIIWNNKGIKTYYKQNVVLFVNKNIKKNTDSLKELQMNNIENMIDIVHPDMYEEKIRSLTIKNIIKKSLVKKCPRVILELSRGIRHGKPRKN